MRIRTRNVLPLAVLVLGVGSAYRAGGQTTPATMKYGNNGFATCGSTAPGLGKIAGQLIADSPGVPLRGGVAIKNGCMTTASAQGTFTLVGILPGDHAVSLLGWAAPVTPVIVHVAADSTSTVTFHLRPENKVAECMAVAECADIIAPAPPAAVAALSDTEQVRESAFRIAIMMGRRLVSMWRATPAPGPICLAAERYNNPASTAVVEAVRLRFPMVLPATGCDGAPMGRGSVAYLAGTRDRASLLTVRHIVIDGNAATADAADNSLSWACTFERSPSGWRPTSCRTTGAA
jgi:hypothetical protein